MEGITLIGTVNTELILHKKGGLKTMKTKKINTKLVLNKKTIVNLPDNAMTALKGGKSGDICPPTYVCPTRICLTPTCP